MPQAADLVIAKDAVPNDVTFEPVSVGGVSTFQDKTAALIEGRGAVTASHRLATSKVAGRTRLVLKVPVEDVVDGVTQVVRVNTAILELITSNQSSTAERSELRVLASNLLANASVVTIVDDGEQVFG